MLDKFKREVGFIKSHSSKKKLGRIDRERDESSDSFSSFEYEKPVARDQFSPYRHPVQKSGVHKSSHLQPHVKQEHRLLKNSKMQALQPKFTNQILKKNFMDREPKGQHKQLWVQIGKPAKEQKEQPDKKEVIHKRWQDYSQEEDDSAEQEQKSEQQTPKLVQQLRPETAGKNLPLQEELSMANINQFQRNKNPVDVHVAQINPRELKTVQQYKQYLEGQSSSSQEQEENKQTLKSRPLERNKPKKAREEQLITEWDKREFKDKSIKRAILNQPHEKAHETRNGIYQTRGGICFELDKQEFKSDTNYAAAGYGVKRGKRKADVNSKEELLRRRMSAKLYDRMARVKIFGYN